MSIKKTIWVTGASSGIGKSLALKFAKEGWLVAASSRRENLLIELCNLNENIYSFPLDVTDENQCKDVFNKILIQFKNLDICVFGAGIHEDPKSKKTFSLEKIKKIMNVNYYGAMNSINSTYEYFKNKKSGQIAFIGSVAGYRGLPNAGAYCSSKSALISFAESLHFDMKKFNVRVSIINPGFIKTPMTDENNYTMPMIKSSEFAADKIYKGLIKNKAFEIHFPKEFTFLMKILRLLPHNLYFKIIKFGLKKINY